MVNISTNNSLGNLLAQAGSTETLRFLADNVGKLIEATVINVSTSKTDAAKTANLAAQNPVTGRSDANTSANTGATTDPRAAQAGSNRGEAARTSPGQYSLQLRIGDNIIEVKSAVAPRLGQLVQLQVLSAKQLQFLPPAQQSGERTVVAQPAANPGQAATVITGSTNLSGAAAQNLADNAAKPAGPIPAAAASVRGGDGILQAKPLPAVGNDQAPLQSPPFNREIAGMLQQRIENALRDTLPRQAAREDLLSSLRAITGSRPQASSLANKTPGTTTSPPTIASGNASARPAPVNANPAAAPGSINPITLPPGNNAVQAAITQLVNSINPLSNLVQANGLKQAIDNSGIGLESKLLKLAANNRAAVSGHETGTRPAGETAAEALSRDHKLALLNLANVLRGQLSNARPGIDDSASTSTLTANPLLQQTPLASLWQSLLQANSPIAASRETDSGNDDTLMQLLRLVMGMAARTQSNQLLSLGSQLGVTPDGNLNQGLLFELPLWFNGQLDVIDIKLEAENQRQARAAAEQLWNVRLKFDLGDYGELLAFASLRGKTVAASLWASNEATADRIATELEAVADNLSNQGLRVQSMQCHSGIPAELNHLGTMNLLDTHT